MESLEAGNHIALKKKKKPRCWEQRGERADDDIVLKEKK